jgi:hypothetical protein
MRAATCAESWDLYNVVETLHYCVNMWVVEIQDDMSQG